MTFLVPFDGTRLSRTALARARVYAIALEDSPRELVKWLLPDQRVELEAVSIIPESPGYARDKGWIGKDEEFSARRVAEDLHRRVADITPSANFHYERVDASASAGTISSRLRKLAREHGATDVFIGSENAGRLVTHLASVGSAVAADREYDVHLIRRPIPEPQLRKLKSNFFETN